jgi:hypothetical protein
MDSNEQLLNIKNRVMVDFENGIFTRRWVKDVEISEDGLYVVFNVPYSESTSDGKTWQYTFAPYVAFLRELTSTSKLDSYQKGNSTLSGEFVVTSRHMGDMVILGEEYAMANAYPQGALLLPSTDWKIVILQPGEWRRANEPYSESDETRVHVVPISFEAFRFMSSDNQGENNDHMTKIGWNPSWVFSNGNWIRAYRPGGYDEKTARQLAERMVTILDNQLHQSKCIGFPKVTYVGLEALYQD